MGKTYYKIKLYGHTAENSQRFVKDLSVLLGVDEQAAFDLLESAPAVIGRTPSQEQAEHLQQRLALIRGLCLVEAEESDEAVSESTVDQPDHGLPTPETYDIEELKKKDSFLSYMWLSALVGVTVIALLVGGTVFLAQWWRLSASYRPASPPPPVETTGPETSEPTVSLADVQRETEGEIERLKAELQELEFQLSWQTDELEQLHRKRPVPYDMVQAMKVRIASTRDRIRQIERKLHRSRAQLPFATGGTEHE